MRPWLSILGRMPRTALPTAAPQPAPKTAAAPLRRHRGPSPQKTEITRNEIVTAAIAEFMEVGIAKATMDKIAKRANLAKGTLYLHFDSKEDLLLGALQVTFSQSALAYLNTPRLPGESMHSYLVRLIVPSMERFHDSVRADLARLVVGEAKSFPVLSQAYHEHIYAPWHAHFEKLFQQALDDGELQGILPSTAAMLMGAPFWVYLANDSIRGPIKPGCSPGQLSKAQIDALFGVHTAAAPHTAPNPTPRKRKAAPKT